MSSPRPIRVAVIFGGRSTEHAISCVSAGSILQVLDPGEFDVVPIGITRAGRWVLTSGSAGLAIDGKRLPEITERSGDAALVLPDPTIRSVDVLAATDGAQVLADIDVVFPVLHGAYGEDGTIQGLLEMAGIPYVGAGVFASAAGMDKEFTKKLATVEGIPTGPYTVLRPGQQLSETDKKRLGLPVFVKPSRAGSSIGITKVSDWADLDEALDMARQVDPKVIVESMIVGREVECGVLEGVDGGPAEASPPAEIRVLRDREFYDFEAKYLDADQVCEFDLPADLPPGVADRVRRYAVRTFDALDCAGLARVDFFVTPTMDVYLNEINTMPGFTPDSLFPRMWATSGLTYPALIARLLRTALHRGTGLR
ncbi:MAG: D-alanine--D-alanine ligase [Dactylosporangium sp.]|nr:D-alanine--D-alanine ligase [Dactylosporangium sp.]NNJ60619.1 D-alanine--D-alanine ligase [Dactylosporangium sp.]